MITSRFKSGGLKGAALLGLVLLGTGVGAGTADTPPVGEFAWRGTLAVPEGASLARVAVPVQALLRMQSSTAHDLRVFNAAGSVVPFALLGGAEFSRAAPAAHTVRYPAYPLFAANGASKPARGAVEVRVDTNGAGSSAWVRWDGAGVGAASAANANATGQPLQAALFDLRAEKQPLDALELAVELPHNALVPIMAASSADLKDWTPLATKGPLYQFDGADAPANTTLELRQPLQVQGRYLRLAWPGQVGVKLLSVTGRVAATQTPAERLRAALPAGTAEGSGSLTWTLPFATPIAALHLQATRDNTLVPVRIEGRSAVSLPWRVLASSVVYRIDTVGRGSSNPPTPLHGASVRGLRVEAGPGLPLPEGGLQATVEFAPLQVAFLTSGSGPFTLAVGRADTAAAAVDAALLGSIAPAKLVDLPLATVADMQTPAPAGGDLDRLASTWLPAGVPLRSVVLWAVLGLGVLVLGGVAYALLRQLHSRR